MKMPSDTHLVFLLALLLIGVYLIKSDENTKQLSTLAVGGFLTLATREAVGKLTGDKEEDEKEDKDKKPAVPKVAAAVLLLLIGAGTAKAQDCDKSLTYTLPRFTCDNALNDRFIHAESSCYRSATASANPATIERTDKRNVRITQLGATVVVAVAMPIFSNHVVNVVRRSTHEQMLVIDAPFNITFMQNVEAVRDRTEMQFVGKPMRPQVPTVYAYNAIAAIAHCSIPDPTIRSFGYLSPEALLDRAGSLSLSEGGSARNAAKLGIRTSDKWLLAPFTSGVYSLNNHGLNLRHRLGLWSGLGVAITRSQAAHSIPESSGCDQTLWTQHVYRPSRFQILKPCVTITGTVMHAKKEPDGDAHLQIKLDKQFSGMLNARNKSAQKGCLVVEPVCQHLPVTQKDAVSACKGFKSSIVVPKAGTHVEVTGPFVIDNEANHGWQEIHAPTSIKVK